MESPVIGTKLSGALVNVRFKGLYGKALSFAQERGESFVNLLTVLIVVAIEQLWDAFAFQCPCTHPSATVYGWVFIIVPAIALGLLRRGLLKCYCSHPFYEEMYVNNYQENEKSFMLQMLPERVKQRARSNVYTLVSSMDHMTENDWKNIHFSCNLAKEKSNTPGSKDNNALPGSTERDAIAGVGTYYCSPLDKWASGRRKPRHLSLIHLENQLPKGLDFIGDAQSTYVYVITGELPVSLHGQINVGDKIVSVNGKSMYGVSYEETLQEMRSTIGNISMCLQYMPEGLHDLKEKIEADKKKQSGTANGEQKPEADNGE